MCHSGVLAALDRQMAASFNKTKRSITSTRFIELQAEQRSWLLQRARCRNDVSCLDATYHSRITQLENWRSYAAKTISYGSRVGMEVDVISVSGLNSNNAVIKTKHTRGNAKKFCIEYGQDFSEKCIKEELAIKLTTEIHGNCSTGVFNDFFGFVHRFEGVSKRHEFDANFDLRLLASPRPLIEGETPKIGELAEGDSASGYFTHMEIFSALCPLFAPSPDKF